MTRAGMRRLGERSSRFSGFSVRQARLTKAVQATIIPHWGGQTNLIIGQSVSSSLRCLLPRRQCLSGTAKMRLGPNNGTHLGGPG